MIEQFGSPSWTRFELLLSSHRQQLGRLSSRFKRLRLFEHFWEPRISTALQTKRHGITLLVLCGLCTYAFDKLGTPRESSAPNRYLRNWVWTQRREWK